MFFDLAAGVWVVCVEGVAEGHGGGEEVVHSESHRGLHQRSMAHGALLLYEVSWQFAHAPRMAFWGTPG